MSVTTNHLVTVSFPLVRGTQVAHIRVAPAKQPVFMKDKGSSAFFIRTGNLTRQLDVAEAHEYISEHWGAELGPAVSAVGSRNQSEAPAAQRTFDVDERVIRMKDRR